MPGEEIRPQERSRAKVRELLAEYPEVRGKVSADLARCLAELAYARGMKDGIDLIRAGYEVRGDG